MCSSDDVGAPEVAGGVCAGGSGGGRLNGVGRYGGNSSGLLRWRNSESFAFIGIGAGPPRWAGNSRDILRPRREDWLLLHMWVPMWT